MLLLTNLSFGAGAQSVVTYFKFKIYFEVSPRPICIVNERMSKLLICIMSLHSYGIRNAYERF